MFKPLMQAAISTLLRGLPIRSTVTEPQLSRSYSSKHESEGEGKVEVCTISESMIDPCKGEPSVVIIGAGMAGLSAAQRLIQCGITNFNILEATDRPGGRIHSCWLGDVIAEMGAQYIEGGCAANPVYNLACQEGLLDSGAASLRKPSGALRGLFCTSEGRAIEPPVAAAAYHAFRHIEQEACALFDMGCGREHGTLLQFLAVRIQQELQAFPEQQRYDAARVMYGLTNCVRCRCGDDLSLVSADQYGSYIAIPGGSVRVPLGFVGVLAPLLRDLPACSVHYGKPVQRVAWGAAVGGAGGSGGCGASGSGSGASGSSGGGAPERPPRAVVHCCDGERFCADYVLVTVSLGVLKEHAQRLFCPTLPCDKMEAIRCLGYGLVDKVFLEYTRPFWAWREGGVRLAWSPDELAARGDWTKGMSCVEEVEGSRHVLCAHVAGPEAAQMELASDEEVAERVTRVLRQFTGDSTLPFPCTVLRSRWATDPYFCGAYSYLAMDASVGHQCDLSAPLPGACEPVPPVLLFAGEATCVGHYSTVHGARLSGIREAERIVQLTKRHGGPPPPACVCTSK